MGNMLSESNVYAHLSPRVGSNQQQGNHGVTSNRGTSNRGTSNSGRRNRQQRNQQQRNQQHNEGRAGKGEGQQAWLFVHTP